MKQELVHCVQECAECHRICLETIHHCLTRGGEHANPDHIRLLSDCAEICQTAANFLTRRSDLYAIVCEACAEICQQCHESCDQYEGDICMQNCAETCRRCAEACQHMAM